MTFLAGLIDLPVTRALAWALVHFVWQGALIGLVTVVALRLFRFAAPTRYAIGVLALAVMLVAPAVTMGVILGGAEPGLSGSVEFPVPVATAPAAERLPGEWLAESQPAVAASAAPAVPQSIVEPVVLGIWLLGVVVLSVRLFGGWVVARRLARRAVRPAGAELQSLAQRIAGRLALDRMVTVVESRSIAVPMLVGWLKPVILLPASALSGLTPTQVEALLAHELAHVRRHDYLVNLLQSAVETLLFYHPAVWWVSREVRREREHCCDDLAVGVCDRLEYVTALASLAAMTTVPRPALAATDGSLVARVRRLLSPSGDEPVSPLSGWMAASVIVLTIVVTSAAVPAAIRSGDVQAPAGGVVAGVPGGVAGGVPGGVPGGVAGGIPGGVPGGVAGGLATAFPVAAQDPPPPPVRAAPSAPTEHVVMPAGTSPASPAPDQDQERVRAIREAERQLREAQRDIEMKRLELELRQAQLESRSQLETAEAQVEILRRQIEAMKQRVEKGLATPEAQAALEAELAAAQQLMRRAAEELTLRQSDIELRQREARARAEYERRMAELDVARIAAQVAEVRSSVEATALRDRDVQAAAVASARAARTADAERAIVIAELEKRLAEARASSDTDPETVRFLEEQLGTMGARYALAVRESAVVASDEPARIGDVLMLTIEGEPALPNRYAVQQDGTIQLPFVGSVRVQGMTADQIRDAVGRQLTERNLKTNPHVTVSIRRPAR